MNRKQKHDNSHLTLEERKIIQAGIENNSTKASIARTIGKDATTVAKEIRKHCEFRARNTYNRPVICAKLQPCSKKPCIKNAKTIENRNVVAVINRQVLVISVLKCKNAIWISIFTKQKTHTMNTAEILSIIERA